MYHRFKRFSFYLGRGVFWFRIRNKEQCPRFMFRIGRENQSG